MSQSAEGAPDEQSTDGQSVTEVFVVDDHEIVRRGLIEMIDMASGLTVVGEAATAAEAIARIEATIPDVVVLDVRLPDGSGVDVCREVRSRHPEVAVLMLTSFTDERAEFEAVLAGAAGYSLKDIRSDALIESIRAVAAGRILLDAAAVTARMQSTETDAGWSALTPQERRVLELIGEGLTNRQIGAHMHLAEKTVKHYVTSLLAKLDMQRRTQAAAYVTHLRDEGRIPDSAPGPTT